MEENSKLKLSNDEETKDPNKILEAEKSFYKNLYATKMLMPTTLSLTCSLITTC